MSDGRHSATGKKPGSGAIGRRAPALDKTAAPESFNAGRGIARAVSEVGFANTSNSDGNSELRSGAVISIDGVRAR